MVNRIILILLVALFLFTGIDKLLHYEGFVNALRNYTLVPPGAARWLAMPVILAELLVAVGLLVVAWRAAAALLAAGLLATFTAAVATNYIYGEKGICGCWFTITLNQGTGVHIVQNLMLIGLALMVWHDTRAGAAAAAADAQTTGEAAG